MRSLGCFIVAAAVSGCASFTSAEPDGSSGGGSTTGSTVDDDTTATSVTTSNTATSGANTTSGPTTGPSTDTATTQNLGTTTEDIESTGGETAQSEDSSAGETTGPDEGVCGDGRPNRGEVCDDGNVDELDGCTAGCLPSPYGVVLDGMSETALVGGVGTVVNDNVDLCPAGSVLVGLEGALSDEGWIGQIRGQCEDLQTLNATPPAVETGGSFSLTPLRGGFEQGGPWSSTCPDNHVVAGLDGYAGSVVDGIAIRCAPLETAGAEGAFTVVRGELETQPVQGGQGGNPINPVACPGGAIAMGLRLQTSSYLNRIQLRCRDVLYDYP